MLLESALAHQEAGQPDVAKQIYQAVLSLSPQDADACHLLGALLYQTGEDIDQAMALVQHATALDSDRPDYHNTLGVLYRRQKLFENSISSLEHAIALSPNYAEAWNNLGATHEDSKNSSAATEAYETALRLDPEYFQAAINLGRLCLHLASYDRATEAYILAVELAPNNTEALFGYGLALEKQNRVGDAVDVFTQVLEISPKIHQAHANLCLLYLRQGQISDAKITLATCQKFPGPSPQDVIEIFRAEAAIHSAEGDFENAIQTTKRLIALQPDNVENFLTLGIFQQQGGQLSASESTLRRALALHPENLDASFNLAVILLRQGRFQDSENQLEEYKRYSPNSANTLRLTGMIKRSRGQLSSAANALEQALILESENTDVLGNLAAVRQDQGRLSDAVALYRRAVDANPNSNVAHSNLLMSLNYRSDSPSKLFHAHQQWAKLVQAGGSKFRERPAHAVAKPDNRRLKIGYVSGDFRSHSVAYFLEPILEHHDKTQFEIFCYAAMDNPDSMTARMAALVDHWRYISAMTDEQLSSRIEEDGVEILVDLSGHTAHNRLPAFARRMAPVQISWLGYPNTTGLDTIDFRFTDAIADPPGSEAHHSEQLFRLSGGFLCYRAPEDAPLVAPAPFIKNQHITFGSFNNAAKITPQVIKTWSSILQNTPNSRLYLKARPFADDDVCSDFLDQFSRHGIDKSRLELTGRTESIADHLSRYCEIDIALDTFPYNGTTTTCEAMWMGVPTVTLCGNRHAGRVGASLLSRVGLENCITRGIDDYVGTAFTLAENHDFLSKLRGELRGIMKNSALCDARLVTSDIENAYQSISAAKPALS